MSLFHPPLVFNNNSITQSTCQKKSWHQTVFPMDFQNSIESSSDQI